MADDKVKESLMARALKAADQVSYQTGAIVSKTVVSAAGGNITLFAFDEGQALSEHSAPFDALVYVLDGEAEIRISGQVHMVKTDEMIIMPAGEPHAVKANRAFKMMLIMIK